MRYGAGPKQTLDIYLPAVAAGPVHVFIHGGGHRLLDKDDLTVAVEPMVDAGAIGIMVNHDLCPDVGLEERFQQVREALVWVFGNVGRYGGDPNRLYVSGHSAGATLAAVVGARGWAAAAGLPVNAVKGLTCVSGPFDLEPLCLMSDGPDYRMSVEQARAMSLLAQPPAPPMPVIIGVGAEETGEFIRQSHVYADACRGAGLAVRFFAMELENHCSSFLPMANPGDAICRAIIAQTGLPSPG